LVSFFVGIITTFSTIASVTGGDLGIVLVITLGFANLIGDGISMGVGDYLSSQAEADHVLLEKKREEWEYDNYPEGEKREMVEILKSKGMDTEDATRLIDIVATKEHKDFFIDFMMHEELETEVPDDPWGPAKEGTVTFLSFLAFGTVPMWVYVICWGAKYTKPNGVFGIACAATVVTLFALGVLQGVITRQNPYLNGLKMTINGSLAAAAAYLVSWGILQAFGGNTGGGCL
jgi:vacuolar iron transporter family protein